MNNRTKNSLIKISVISSIFICLLFICGQLFNFNVFHLVNSSNSKAAVIDTDIYAVIPNNWSTTSGISSIYTTIKKIEFVTDSELFDNGVNDSISIGNGDIKVNLTLDTSDNEYNALFVSSKPMSLDINASGTFSYASALSTIMFNNTVNTLFTTDMSGLFKNCSFLENINLDGFDTSEVTDMSFMFSECLNLTNLDLSNFNTSKVTDMSMLFSDCGNLTNIDLSNFDTSNVVNMDSMFMGCESIEMLDLTKFDTRNVTNMKDMFNSCKGLKTILCKEFNITKVSIYDDMFTGCYEIEGAIKYNETSDHEISNANSQTGFFTYFEGNVLEGNNQNVNPYIDKNMTFLVDVPYKFFSNVDGNSFDVLNMYVVSQESSKTRFTFNSSFMDEYYERENKEYNITVKFGSIESNLTFNFVGGELSHNWSILANIRGDILNNDIDLKSIRFINNKTVYDSLVNSEGVLNVSSTLDNKVIANVSVEDGFKYIDIISNGIISLPSDSSNLFSSLIALESIDFNDSVYSNNVIYMNRMFGADSNLTSLNLSTFDTSNVIDMSKLFDGCIGLNESLDLSNFSSENLVNTSYMFNDCRNLKAIIFGEDFTCYKVVNMGAMFCHCDKVSSLDLSHFSTGNVTDMSNMFLVNQGLTHLNINHFDVSKVTNFNRMFAWASNIQEFDISSWNTSSATNMGEMFIGAFCGENLDVNFTLGDGFNTSHVTNFYRMFYGASKIHELNLSNFDMSNCTNATNFVTDMKKLYYIDISENAVPYVRNSITSSEWINSNTNNTWWNLESGESCLGSNIGSGRYTSLRIYEVIYRDSITNETMYIDHKIFGGYHFYRSVTDYAKESDVSNSSVTFVNRFDDSNQTINYNRNITYTFSKLMIDQEEVYPEFIYAYNNDAIIDVIYDVDYVTESFYTPNLNRTGYTFKGWNDDPEASSGFSGLIMPNRDNEILYAIWEPTVYTISFDSAGGNSVSSINVLYGNSYGVLPSTIRNDYIFSGWYYNDNRLYDNGIFTFDENITLVARWNLSNYELIFNTNGGSPTIASQTITYGSPFGVLPSVSRTGYTFMGWYLNGINVTPDMIYETFDNAILDARWEVINYTVTFNANGGTVSEETKIITYGSNYELVYPTRSGYTFLGWYRENTFLNKVTNLTVFESISDVTLYAKWNANSYDLIYHYNNGNSNNSKIYSYGSVINGLPSPSKVGHTFIGWYSEDDGGSLISNGNIFEWSNNKDIYARYSINSYNITFNETINANESKNYGETYVIRSDYSKESDYVPIKVVFDTRGGENISDVTLNITKGYTFKNLIIGSETYNAGDSIVIEGNVNANITFNENNEYPTIDLPLNIYKEGYEFLGWRTNEFTNQTIGYSYEPHYDITFYAYYSRNYTYEVISGDKQEINVNTLSSNVTFTIDGDFNKFKKLEIGNITLVNGIDYIVYEGSTIIKLTDKGVSKICELEPGKHNVIVSYSDNTVINISLTTFKEVPPKTGDSIMMYVIVTLITIIGFLIFKKRV